MSTGGTALNRVNRIVPVVIPPPGPPFAANSAAEGLSVDPVTGKIVLGTDGSYGTPDQFTTARIIEASNKVIVLEDTTSGTPIQGSLMQLGSDRLTIDNAAVTTGVQIQALPGQLVFILADSATNAPKLGLSTGNNDVRLINRDGLVELDCQNTGLSIRVDLINERVIIAPPATLDNGQNLQVAGNMSLGTDVTANFDFPNTPAQQSSDLSSALFIGANPGDVVLLGVDPAAVLPNSCYTAWVSAPDTVTIRFNNYSAAAQDPPAGAFKVSVIKMT